MSNVSYEGTREIASSADDETSSYHRFYVTAWKFNTVQLRDCRPKRIIHRALQCMDALGPKLTPDVVHGWDISRMPMTFRQEE